MRQNNELIRRYGLDPEPDMRPLGRVPKNGLRRPDRVWRLTGATVYAANFTLDEMRQMVAFFRQPGWTKADRKMARKPRRSVGMSAARQPRGYVCD